MVKQQKHTFTDDTLKLVLTPAQLFECWVLVTGRISPCEFVKHPLPGDSVISVDVVLSVVSSKNYFFILKRVSLGDVEMKFKYFNLRPF